MQDLAATPVCRLIQKVKVRPHACYRLSCWAKTRDLAPTGAFRLMAIGATGGRPLSFHEGGLEPTRDWTRVEVVFNSQDQTEVNLYAGLWGGKAGTLWLDDLALEEMSLVNVLRRDGCPLTVTSEDGKIAYVEGRDFEPVRDPKLGMVPYEGEYEFNHPGPPLRLTAGSRIKDGDRLRVSWYHPVLVHGVVCRVLPQRAEGLRPAPRPGAAGQRSVSPQDVLHAARRDAGRQLVPGLPVPQAHAGRTPGRQRPTMRPDHQGGQPRGPSASSGRTCSTRTTTP